MKEWKLLYHGFEIQGTNFYPDLGLGIFQMRHELD